MTLITESAYWVPCPLKSWGVWGRDLRTLILGPNPQPHPNCRLGDDSCSQSCCLYNLLWARTEFLGLVYSYPVLSNLVFLDGVSDGQTWEILTVLCHLIHLHLTGGRRSASTGQHHTHLCRFSDCFLDCYMYTWQCESPQNMLQCLTYFQGSKCFPAFLLVC